jgi:hypothetical protein
MRITKIRGKPMSHPMVKEQAVLILPRRRITNARPSLSERKPMESDAENPIRWKNATMLAPKPASFSASDPLTARQADRNAGVHDHIPISSQLCQIYAAINNMAGLFRNTSTENFCSSRLGDIELGVEARLIHAKIEPTNGPRQVRRKES